MIFESDGWRLGGSANLSVEGHEEDEVLNPGDCEHQRRCHRIVASEYQWLEGVEEDHDELHQLDGGEVLLPPEVGLQGGSAGGQQVVEVHHGVHPRVQEGKEPAVASTNKSWEKCFLTITVLQVNGI